MDNNAQVSAELILLFGGIMVVVLLAVYMYKTYIADLSGEIQSNEVNEFKSKLSLPAFSIQPQSLGSLLVMILRP